MNTATDLTREHYQRPEVKEIVMEFCHEDRYWRPLNGDKGWYKSTDDGKVRLRRPEDYDNTTRKYRTIYALLDLFEPKVKDLSSEWDEGKNKPVDVLGTFREEIAYTLGGDIDSIGHDLSDPVYRIAVEDLAKYLVGRLNEAGIKQSVHCLLSGGGVYVFLHHNLCRAPAQMTPEDRFKFFSIRTGSFKLWLADVEKDFFELHPEHVGKTKIDKLTNQKRKFKAPLSIHAKHDLAVIPLDPANIKIDLVRAKLPLSDEVLQEARNWYKKYDPTEIKALDGLLEGSIKKMHEEMDAWKDRGGNNGGISRMKEPLPRESMCPLMQNIARDVAPGKGPHRALAVMAAGLYQFGWEEDKAFEIWQLLADKCGVESRIFELWFGQMSMPNCATVQRKGGGYPELSMGDLGYCKPDEHCKGCVWPGDYPVFKSMDELSSQRELTLEQLTKATGKMVQIDPDTGDPVLDDEGEPVLVAKRTLSPSKAAKAIIGVMDLKLSELDKNDLPKIWNYDGSIWKPDGERKIRNVIYPILGDLAYNKGYQEMLHNIRARTDPVLFDQDPYLFPAQDGVIDLRTGKIRQHSPEDLFTFTYNACCNHPHADHEPFLWFLASIFPDIRDCLTAIDIISAVGIRIPFEVFIFLIGSGENGKGILEKLILALYTMQRASATKIQEVSKSNFASGSLLNKDVWIVTEVETIKDAMSIIKGVSSGEMLDSDVKYALERAQGIPHLLTIIDSNKPLDFNDNSWGRIRRTEKLDTPYEFGYRPGVRPKDPHLLEKLTTPEVLAGIVQIIRARSPTLIESKRIYHRKSHEAQEAELERQRFSIQYFCNECLDTEWVGEEDPMVPVTKAPRLEVPVAYTAYLEYCKLYNVPEPANKNPFGKYLTEKYKIDSEGTSRLDKDGKKQNYRYYPGLFLVKSPELAYAEFDLMYYRDTTGVLSNTTGILQEWIGNNSNSKDNTTATTAEQAFLISVIEELESMYKYVHSCVDPSDISYSKFLAHFPVVAVVLEKNKPVDDEKIYYRRNSSCSTPVVQSGSPVVDPETVSSIDADLQRGEDEAKAKEAHDRELAEKHTKKTDPRHSSCLSCGDPIGPGHSTYFETFCGSCGPKLAMVRPAVKAHPDGFTLSELWEDLAARGDRPPLKAHLPGMLQYLGYIEDGSVWRLPKSPAEPDPEQVGAEA